LLAPQPVPAPRPSPLLNTDLLRRRRIELRKSRRDLAQALGVAGAAIAGLENGTNHADQTLGTLAKLAETLAVDLPTLLTGAARTPARFSQQAVGQIPSQQPSQADADRATLGAALHAAANPVSAAALADALGWTLPRLTRALDSLAAVAPTVGLRIDTSGGMVALVRAAEPLTSAQLTGVLRRVVSRGIETTAARLICAALGRAVCAAPGRAGSGGLLRGNADRVAAGLLVNADLLALEEHGDVELTPATRTALYLPPPIESALAQNEQAGGADA
jgi:transcriptional regulator with XRE-family HTH domain